MAMATTEDEAGLGARLRALREARGLSQERLAARAEVSTATVRRTELGHYEPTLSSLRAIARALGVSLSELIEAEGSA